MRSAAPRRSMGFRTVRRSCSSSPTPQRIDPPAVDMAATSTAIDLLPLDVEGGSSRLPSNAAVSSNAPEAMACSTSSKSRRTHMTATVEQGLRPSRNASTRWETTALLLAPLAPLGRRRMHVRVKFFDGPRDARDTAGYPFEGQPHSGFRRAECPHLVDIREGQAARSRTDLPGSDEGYGSAGQQTVGSPSAPDWE